MSYIQGIDRDQKMLFPPAIDDYINEDNIVRFIEAFVNGLDLEEAGFERTEPEPTGRPGYDPHDMLKLYIYGYLNKIRSSRKLECETHRNLELMWLLRGLTPDFKTIADFRKDNKAAFKKVFRQFNEICHGLELFDKGLIVVDGSKFKAVNSKDKNFTKKKLKKRLDRLDEALDKYLRALESSDEKEADTSRPSAEELREKIQHLKAKKGRYRKLIKQLELSGESQISLTDPDSRSMGHSPKVGVGYNVQVAVDSKHKLIVDYEVANDTNDLNQLSTIALGAKEALGVGGFEVVADQGYYNGPEIKKCEDEGLTLYIAKPDTSANKKLGLFGKDSFRYDPVKDIYVCPAGNELTYRFSMEIKGHERRFYTTARCRQCPLKKRCTRSNRDSRKISRWPHESILDAMGERVAKNPEKMKKRKAIVEHPFGTIKHWSDQGFFLMIGFEKVRAEFGLTALAYNIRRVMNIVGIPAMTEAVA